MKFDAPDIQQTFGADFTVTSFHDVILQLFRKRDFDILGDSKTVFVKGMEAFGDFSW